MIEEELGPNDDWGDGPVYIRLTDEARRLGQVRNAWGRSLVMINKDIYEDRNLDFDCSCLYCEYFMADPGLLHNVGWKLRVTKWTEKKLMKVEQRLKDYGWLTDSGEVVLETPAEIERKEGLVHG